MLIPKTLKRRCGAGMHEYVASSWEVSPGAGSQELCPKSWKVTPRTDGVVAEIVEMEKMMAGTEKWQEAGIGRSGKKRRKVFLQGNTEASMCGTHGTELLRVI